MHKLMSSRYDVAGYVCSAISEKCSGPSSSTLGLAAARVFGDQVPNVFLPLARPAQICASFSATHGSPRKFLPGMWWSDVYVQYRRAYTRSHEERA